MTLLTDDKYKQIAFDAHGKLDINADNAVALLNEQFSSDEFHVVRNGDTLDIWLRQVNVEDLSDAVDRVSIMHGNRDAMIQILTEVMKVKSYGLNGRKRLYVGYNSERKVTARKQKEKQRGKHYYANGHDFSRLINPIPAAFSDQILCGDSEEVLKELPDNCVDLVLTSPPYNFGLEYQEADTSDATDWDAYFTN